MITLLTLEDEREWKQIIQKSLEYDFYHTWDYHKWASEGVPFLFVYSECDDFVAFPLIKRPIPNSDFFDLTCVYGYTGPVSNKKFQSMSEHVKKSFKTEFSGFLNENKIVSVFLRLHPFFGQDALLGEFEGIYANGKIVIIDLRQSLQEQRLRYKGRLAGKIQKLRNNGFYIKETRDATDVKAFSEIYAENMERVKAKQCYIFDEQYFWKFLNSSEMQAKLILVCYDSEPVSGALVVFTKYIIQIHLLATKSAWMKFSPAKLLTEEITLIGRDQGMHYLNLGSGYGFNQDTLFEFKALFSDLFLNYQSWRYIADQKIYHKLVCDANIDPQKEVDFFPLYRYQENRLNPSAPAVSDPNSVKIMQASE